GRAASATAAKLLTNPSSPNTATSAATTATAVNSLLVSARPLGEAPSAASAAVLDAAREVTSTASGTVPDAGGVSLRFVIGRAGAAVSAACLVGVVAGAPGAAGVWWLSVVMRRGAPHKEQD